MTADQMRRALELNGVAASLHRKLTTFVLLRRDANHSEKLWCGPPSQFDREKYSAEPVAIPEEARRYVFRLWKKETAKKLNEIIRELNQLGASHDFKLIEFSPHTGEPVL